MGSKTFDGVRFSVFPNDHSPRHVHAFVSGARVVIDLLPSGDVDLANRKDRVSRNAKKSDVEKALGLAAENSDELNALWEGIHGNA